MNKLILFLTILISATIAQEVPRTITFQGVLKDVENQPYADGQYELVFRLYQPSTGTTYDEIIIWEESHMVDVKDGIFSTLLRASSGDLAAAQQPCKTGIRERKSF